MGCMGLSSTQDPVVTCAIHLAMDISVILSRERETPTCANTSYRELTAWCCVLANTLGRWDLSNSYGLSGCVWQIRTTLMERPTDDCTAYQLRWWCVTRTTYFRCHSTRHALFHGMGIKNSAERHDKNKTNANKLFWGRRLVSLEISLPA